MIAQGIDEFYDGLIGTVLTRTFTSFVGRRGLLAETRQRLASAQVVTLTGPGGIGKTRLAHRVVVDGHRSFRDGCWTAELFELSDPALLADTVALAVGLRTEGQMGAREVLVEFLANRHSLLVLDNCEHLLEACASLVETLRSHCPHLRILATSRQPLGLSGEEVLEVPPMTVPDPLRPTPPEAMDQYEAVSLFVDRATSASSAFTVTEDNAADVAQLCAALEGVPLAVELAAARSRTLSPRAMLDQIQNRYQLLSQGYRDAVGRHRSLNACVEWSYDLCDPSEQALWARLSVFAGGCTLAAARNVCAGEGIEADDVLTILSSLVDQSVVTREDVDDGTTRYRMLAYLREYGLERLSDLDQLARWQDRHLAWCIGRVSRFQNDWVGPRQAIWLSELEHDHDNLRAALELCTRDPDRARTGLMLATDLDSYWAASGRVEEARHWLGVALDNQVGEPADRAVADVLDARFAAFQHDLGAARARLAEALVLAEEADDDRARGLALIPQAMLAVWADDNGAAVAATDRAVTLLHETDDRSGQLVAWAMAGVCRGFADDRAGAVAAHRQVIALAERYDETFRRSFSLSGLGEQALVAGDLVEATALFSRALRIKVELGDQIGVAVALDSLGRVAIAEGRGQRAAVLLGAAQAIWDRIGMSETGNPFAYASNGAGGIAAARKLIGKQEFRVSFRRGAALTQAQAVALALDGDLAEVTPVGEPEPSPLTRRETEVADLVADGLSNPEIAERLVISVRTAQGHVENILRKLGFNSRSKIAAWVTQRRADERAAVTEPPA